MPPALADALMETVDRRFEQTVPRSLVHKRSLENVLLTEIRACTAERFVGSGRLPTAHRFFNDPGRTPQTDILYYTELGRQASLAISHAFLNVSRDDVFIFEGSDAALVEGAWWAAGQADEDGVAIDVRVREIARRKNGAVNRVVAEHAMWIGDRQVFRGTGAWTIQPAALFQRLRRTSARPAAAAGAPAHARTDCTRARLPHASGGNVVISSPRIDDDGAFVSSLIVDHTHPYFFDHACDHVPGMLLLEGCAQLALAAAAAAGGAPQPSGVTAYDMTFSQFVERGIVTTLSADVDTTGCGPGAVRPPAVRISITQEGAPCGEAIVGLAAAAEA